MGVLLELVPFQSDCTILSDEQCSLQPLSLRQSSGVAVGEGVVGVKKKVLSLGINQGTMLLELLLQLHPSPGHLDLPLLNLRTHSAHELLAGPGAVPLCLLCQPDIVLLLRLSEPDSRLQNAHLAVDLLLDEVPIELFVHKRLLDL